MAYSSLCVLDFHPLIVNNRVELAPGVDYVRTADVKDQIELSGIDIAAVSMTGMNLIVSCFNRTSIMDFLHLSEVHGHSSLQQNPRRTLFVDGSTNFGLLST